MSRYYDVSSANMLLGALYQYPPLFDTQEAQALSEGDFVDPMAKIAYSIMYNLFSIGHTKFSAGAIESYIKSKPTVYKFFNDEIEVDEDKVKRGDFFFSKLHELGDATHFSPALNQVKKLSLLRNLERHGVSVKEFYDWDSENPKVIEFQNNWLEKTSIKDIANQISDKIELIINSSSSGVDRVSAHVSDGLFDLVKSFKETPDFGSNFPDPILNTITRGARLGKFYLRSAPTGGGTYGYFIKETA